MSSISRPFSKVIRMRVAKRAAFDRDAKPGEIADAGDLAAARLLAEHDGQRRVDIGLARRQHADRHAAAAIVAGSALEIRQLRRLDAGHHKRVPGEGIAADQRAAAVGEQRIGFEGRARAFVELAFEPLDLERPAEAVGNSLRQRDVKPAVGLAALMHGKRRQVLVETDFQRIVIRARAPPSPSQDSAAATARARRFMASSGSIQRPRSR